MQQIGLEAVLKMGNFNKGRQQYQSGLKEMNQQTDTAGRAMETLGAGFEAIAVAGGVAVGAFYAVKKAMDMGKEGAAILDTTESFDRLMDSMGVAPDILQRMSRATRGTVDDMTLMSSTMTLVAGTSDRLGRSMVDAAPELLEIAKAANKLNPALGDTAFLYQSLATGIKRASPMILDNLGLTIKIGDANEKLAQKLGKTVDALTAEEKQMALLEATLEAGDRMIEQAGGNVEALGDAYAQAEVQLKNASDTIKTLLVPATASLADALADVIKLATDYDDVVRQNSAAANEGAKSYEDYMDAMIALALETGTMFALTKSQQQALKEYAGGLREADRMTRNLMAAGGVLTREQWEQLQSTNALNEAYGTSETRYLAAARAAQAYALAASTAVDETVLMEAAANAVNDVLGNLSSTYAGFINTLATGIVKYRDLGATQAKSAEDYKKSLEELRKKAKSVYGEVRRDFEASLPDSTSVAQRLGMAEDAWDEWGLRLQDIINLGVASPWYDALQQMGMAKPPDVGVKEWAADLKAQFYEGELPQLINTQAAAWVENTGVMKQAQAEATAAYNAEIANRKAAIQGEIDALKAAREAQLEAERQARNEATIELALQLAEQSGMLKQWSQQRFGPDFGQVADSAAEVSALLESGMLSIDTTLQNIITNNVAGVQTALDTTGQLAGETQLLLDQIASADWAKQKEEGMKTAFAEGLNPENVPVDEVLAKAEEIATGIGDKIIPEAPFYPLLSDFEGTSTSIVKKAADTTVQMKGQFGKVDNDWATLVSGMETDWKRGMQTVSDAIQKKVIDKIAEIPREVVITVTVTEGEGEGNQAGGEERQHGGPVLRGRSYIVGERGPELFVPNQSGFVMPRLNQSYYTTNSDISNSYGGDTIVLNVNSREAWGMAQRWVDVRRRERLTRGM